MVYPGTVYNGVVVLDGGIHLPEGAAVRVELDSKKASIPEQSTELDPLFRMSELAVDTGIPDLAANADHYLYGFPRMDDVR